MADPQDASDLRQRFTQIEKLDEMKSKVLEDALTRIESMSTQLEEAKTKLAESTTKLEESKTQLAETTNKRKREVQDLDVERVNRRSYQEKATEYKSRLTAMDQGKFMLVLMDADGQTNLFRDEYLTRGAEGGHAAANALMEKVREYSINDLKATVEKVNALPIMVKSYANLHGLSQFCLRDQRLSSPTALPAFWTGFSRSSPLVDFIDVGSGKEEADSKLRRKFNRLRAV